MEIRDIFFEDIDDVLERDSESEEVFDAENFEITGGNIGDDAIVTCGFVYRVLNKGLIFVEGTYCCRDEDTGALSQDFSLTLLYEDVSDSSFDPSDYVYFEQGLPVSAIRNYMHYKMVQGKDKDEKEDCYSNSSYADALCG